MALISKIRNNSWILIILIGLGMAAFLLMDMFQSDRSIFGSSANSVGNINGKSVSIAEFQQRDQVLYGNSNIDPYVRRDNLWELFVQENLLNTEGEKLGIGVGDEEFGELIGDKGQQFISPLLINEFGGPQSFNFNDYRTNIIGAIRGGQVTNPNFQARWTDLERRIALDQSRTKLASLVSKGSFTPTWMVELENINQNQKADFEYVFVPFDEIENDAVTVEDADIASYMKKTPSLFTTKEPTRTVEYISFDIVPSSEDSAKLRKELADIIGDFRTGNDTTITATRNGELDGAYFKKDALGNTSIADSLFKVPVGTVIGPYIEKDRYRLAKVVDRKILPDSVQARHILRPGNNPTELQASRKLVDSLITVLNSGKVPFDTLALKFGTDGTRNNGGDLGMKAPGAYVKPFNDLVFYRAVPGKYYKVETQFGVHIVEVTKSKKTTNTSGVRVAYLNKPIIPSEATQQAVYDKALKFQSENKTLADMKKNAEAQGIKVFSAPRLTQNGYQLEGLDPGETSRNIVKKAYLSSVGDRFPDIYTYEATLYENFYRNKYVIAGLAATAAAGASNPADYRSGLETLVRNEKKGEMIAEKMKGSDLAAIAAGFEEVEVQKAEGVNFNSGFLPNNIGNEPKVAATASGMNLNDVSEPIIGNTGVYVIKVINKAQSEENPNIAGMRKAVSTKMAGQADQRLMESMKKMSDVEDARFRFY